MLRSVLGTVFCTRILSDVSDMDIVYKVEQGIW